MEIRKYDSPKLKEILDEISPVEMEKTKMRMLVSKNIEDLLTERNWSQNDFADKTNFSKAKVKYYLSGTKNFTLSELTELAFLFEIKIEELFKEDASKKV